MNIGGIGYPGSILRNTGSKPKSSSALDTDLILDQTQGYTSPASFLIVTLKGATLYRNPPLHCRLLSLCLYEYIRTLVRSLF